jgi:uncharacterized membrane protein YeaQ/YmgE (transglycosylase-associated protein family)
MNQPLGILGTPGMGLFGLIIIGGFAGWIAGMIVGRRHWLPTNILIGIVGSWLGSELADLSGIAVRGALNHFIAALVGSCIVLYVWQMLHPIRNLPPRQGNDQIFPPGGGRA